MRKFSRKAVAARAAGRCEYCRLPASQSVLPHTIDHIRARKHRGKTTLQNTRAGVARGATLPRGAMPRRMIRKPTSWFACSTPAPTSGKNIFPGTAPLSKAKQRLVGRRLFCFV